jgi:putative peptidoglycan lipid II flippase
VPLITSLFHYGAFTAHDVDMTRWALVAYSFGLLGLILVKILAPGFYARQNVRTPVKIALVTLLATQALNLALIPWLARVGIGHAGLAASIGLAACLNALLLYRGLRRHNIYRPQPGWPVFYAKLALALCVMGLALWLLSGSPDNWLRWTLKERLLRLSVIVSCGAVAYFATLWASGFRIKDFKHRSAE